MKKINIFVAVSSAELKKDSIAIKDVILQLNEMRIGDDIYFDATFRDEYGGAPTTADEAAIQQSELVFFLVAEGSPIPPDLQREYAFARDLARREKKPLIALYVRQNEHRAAHSTAADFLSTLEQDNRSYSLYKNDNAIKLAAMMRIRALRLSGMDVRVEEEKLFVNGAPMFGIQNTPMYAENEQLRQLKLQKNEITVWFNNQHGQYAGKKDDLEFYKQYISTAQEKSRLELAVQRAEKSTWQLAVTMFDATTRGRLTAGQQLSYRRLELGDYNGALDAIAFERIENDLLDAESVMDVSIVSIQNLINELLQRIQIVKAGDMGEAEIADVLRCYQTVAEKIERYNLRRAPLQGYAAFLQQQGELEEALSIAERLQHYYSKPQDAVEEMNLAALENFLGGLYKAMGKYRKAERSYLSARNACRRVSAENSAYLESLAGITNNLGILYKESGQFEEAERSWIETLDVYRGLSEKNSDALPGLAAAQNNLGTLYDKLRRYGEAETFYMEALELRRKLAEKHPEQFEPAVASSYMNLAALYARSRRGNDAEEAYRMALMIRKSLSDKKPAAYDVVLGDTYQALGRYYYSVKRIAESEEAYQNAIDIRKRLCAIDTSRYEVALADTHSALATIYTVTEQDDRAEKSQLAALAVYQRLAEGDAERHLPKAASSYQSLAKIYEKTGRYTEAERFYRTALEMRLTLSEIDEKSQEEGRGEICHALGLLMQRSKRIGDAESFFAEAVRLRKSVTAYKPSAEPKAAASMVALLELYCDAERYEEGEEICRSALGLYQRLSERNAAYKQAAAACGVNLGRCSEMTGRFAQAERAYNAALNVYKELEEDQSGSAREDMAEIYCSLGSVYRNLHDTDKSKRAVLEALKYWDDGISAEEKPLHVRKQMAECYTVLATACRDEGDNLQAAEYTDEATKIYRSLAQQNPDDYEDRVAEDEFQRANICVSDGEFARAEKHFRSALEIFQRRGKGRFEPRVAEIFKQLSIVYEAMGQGQEAEEAVLNALAIYQRLGVHEPEKFEPLQADCHSIMAGIYRRLQRFVQAEDALRSAMKIRRRLSEKEPMTYEPLFAATCSQLGQLYVTLKRYAEAENANLTALEVYKKLSDRDPTTYEPLMANVYLNLGASVFRTKKDPEEEKIYFERALYLYRKYEATNDECRMMAEKTNVILSKYFS